MNFEHLYRSIANGSGGVLSIGFIVAVGLWIVVFVLARDAERRRLRWPTALLLLYGVFALLRHLAGATSPYAKALAIAASFSLLAALARLLFTLIVEIGLTRYASPPSKIVRDISLAMLMAGVGLLSLQAAGVEAGSLLTTSALLTAVIGLSLQDTLGNMFAGLSIQAQTPFEVGDWIAFDDAAERTGRVVEINWRATKLMTNDDVEVIVPNGVLAKAAIRNFSKPNIATRLQIAVFAPLHIAPPDMHRLLLSTIEDVPGVLSTPAASVITRDFSDRGTHYILRFFTDDFTRRDPTMSDVRDRIWTAMNRAGYDFPYLGLDVYTRDESDEQRAATRSRKVQRKTASLKQVDFLQVLPEPLLELLAEKSASHPYVAGEMILKQGDTSTELFVVEYGEVSVLLSTKSNEMREVARLGAGKFFGEMSLMTGEARSASVRAISECRLLVVRKEAFQHILEKAPDLAQGISEVLAQRQAQLSELAATGEDSARSNREHSRQILLRIRKFFSL